ncbi:hypothetical protein M413DRAFT_293917 [Hebeloma cylindrosporum]|uniref:Uncharacterized protein n=1 Tax=Hebeloma cylindrosporum TaxID=76867 RepID=A0A0C3CPM9_HEBCY|nr:hypothetical protein M413DRAFT_293917 [Hebeloma cylindrosporum h7]
MNHDMLDHSIWNFVCLGVRTRNDTCPTRTSSCGVHEREKKEEGGGRRGQCLKATRFSTA